MKPKKKPATKSKDHQKKVFDVSRPGKAVAGATSRPVIVGHKPQIKDPMMSERNEVPALLDSKQKVVVAAESAPTIDATAASEATVAPADQTQTPPVMQTEAEPTQDNVAAVALSDTVEAPPVIDAPQHNMDAPEKTAQPPTNDTHTVPQTPAPAAAMPSPGPTMPEQASPVIPTAPEAAATPASTATPSAQTKSTGIIFEDDAASDLLAPPSKPVAPVVATPKTDPDAVEQGSPIPPEEMPKAQVFVAHHARSGGWKVFTILMLFVILLAIGLDIALDMGLLTLEGVPHTSFF